MGVAVLRSHVLPPCMDHEITCMPILILSMGLHEPRMEHAWE